MICFLAVSCSNSSVRSGRCFIPKEAALIPSLGVRIAISISLLSAGFISVLFSSLNRFVTAVRTKSSFSSSITFSTRSLFTFFSGESGRVVEFNNTIPSTFLGNNSAKAKATYPPIECPTMVQCSISSFSKISFTWFAIISIVCTGAIEGVCPCPKRSMDSVKYSVERALLIGCHIVWSSKKP